MEKASLFVRSGSLGWALTYPASESKPVGRESRPEKHQSDRCQEMVEDTRQKALGIASIGQSKDDGVVMFRAASRTHMWKDSRINETPVMQCGAAEDRARPTSYGAFLFVSRVFEQTC